MAFPQWSLSLMTKTKRKREMGKLVVGRDLVGDMLLRQSAV